MAGATAPPAIDKLQFLSFICLYVQVLVKKVFGESGQRASKRKWILRHLDGVHDSDASSIQR